MTQRRGLLRTARRAAVGLAYLGLMMATGASAWASGQALVIGEASYTSLPTLPGCALSANAVAAALRAIGLTVNEQDDGSSGALYAAITVLTRQVAAANTPTVVYFCGYATSFEDRPFLLPVSASVARPADALTQGLLAKTLLNAAMGDKTKAGVLIIDAVPMPNGPMALSLDILAEPTLPPTLGYLATSTTAPGNTPTPLASALVPLLRSSAVEIASLMADIQRQLAAVKNVTVSALHLPGAELYLGATATTAATNTGLAPVAAPHAAVSPVAVASRPAAEAARSLPAEDQMTEDQRRFVQRALTHLGYYDARTDGVFGPETRAAIRRWQHEVHLSMTGRLTAEQASKLTAAWD